MHPATVLLLSHFGFECVGLDPDAMDHHLYALAGSHRVISVPSAGCSAPDIARLIFHAGAATARKEIATAHHAFLQALKV